MSCDHCGEPTIRHPEDHPNLCCDCFDLSCGMPLEDINQERAGKGQAPITKAWIRADVNLSLADLVTCCTRWLADPSATFTDFARIVSTALVLLTWPDGHAKMRLVDELGAHFEVAPRCVFRWGSGSIQPHSLIQRQIVEELLRRVQGKLSAPPATVGG